MIWVKTPRRHRNGQAVEILIDFWPDTGQGGTVPVEVKGGAVYGNAVPRRTADAMRSAGRELHAQHADSCTKRNTSRKSP